MKILKRSHRVYDTTRFGQPEIRLQHRTAKGKKSPSYVLRCGCCDQRLEIHYADDGLEIGGVNGALEDWREILLPLLLIERKGARFIDVSRTPKGSANLEGCIAAERARRGRKTAVIQWRAEPANTPLVEQARLWHLCLRGGFWWERNSDLLASENEQRRPTRKAEVFERLLPPRERKLRGCGKLVWVDAAVDWNQPAKRGASTNAEF